MTILTIEASAGYFNDTNAPPEEHGYCFWCEEEDAEVDDEVG